MIHYTCDYCKRIIDFEHEVRFVVKIELYPAIDDLDSQADPDRDHLQEIENILSELEEEGDFSIDETLTSEQKFDLCNECRQKFLRNPLGRRPSAEFDFSNN